jgi:type VI protein secretion system component Hcp
MRRAGETAGREFLRFKFDTVFTTKIDWSGPGDEGPEESVTFVYGKLGIKVTPPETDLKPVVAGWDQVMNKAADDFAGA